MLGDLDILICLLPLTPETRSILSKDLFALLPRGCYLINCARGGHLVEEDLLAALESGQLGGAALDVFAQEPLPEDHPFWRHEKIALTPHVSAPTRPDTAIQSVAETIRGFEAGEGLRYLVDFTRGY